MADIRAKASVTKKLAGDMDEDECNFEETLKNLEMWKEELDHIKFPVSIWPEDLIHVAEDSLSGKAPLEKSP